MTYRHPPANTTEPGVITLAGDLGGTEASPSVLRINGISVSSTASANQVLVTTSSSATTWAQIVDAYVSATAAISGTKINPNFGSQGIITTGTLSVGAATATSLQDTGLSTGVVHSDSSGNFTSSLIVNADVSATAAIAGSKISPNFGTQALTAGTFSLGTSTSANSIFGSLTYTVKTFSGNGTIDTTTNDLIVYADTSSAPFTLTLPAPTTGRFLIIKDKKQTFATNNLTIASHAGEKIDGSVSNLVLSTNNEEAIFTSDGTDWYTSIFTVSVSGTAGGDLSGTYPNPTVAKLDGYVLPSPTPGVLEEVGGVLQWGAVNLASSTYVTGILPTGNQAAQTMSGDVTGTTASNTVISLTGSAGIVGTASSTTTIQFNSGSSSPTINQANTSSASGQALTINAQNATGATHNGGNLILAGGTSGSATAGTVQLQTAGSTRLTAGATGVITIANLSTGVVHADGSGNLTSSTIIDTDVSATANIAVSKLASGTAAQVLLNNATPTPTWTTLTGDVTVASTGVTTVNAISGSTPIVITPSELQWKNTTTSPLIDQAANTSASGVGQTFTLQSQSATGSNSTGGNLILASGTGTSSDGYIAIETGQSERLVVNANGVVQITNLSTGVVHSDSIGNLTSSLIVNADVDSAAAIAYSKLNLSNSIVNADVNSAAAIAYSKLNLTNSIVNADINTAAAIAGSKISPNFGTQALTAGTFSLGTSTSANSLFGSITFTTKTFNTTGTIDTTTTDMLIYADTSGGAFNLTLPTPTTGRTLIVKDKKQTFGTNNLTIVRSGSEKIDGVAASLILATNNEEVIFTSDGTDWYTSLFAESTTGAAGGDLSGTYPNPTVAKVNGVSYPASPSTNTVPVVTGSNTVTYQQIVNAQIDPAAAIAVSKLANGTADQLLDTNHAGTTVEWFTLGGDATFASHNLTLANTAVTPGTYGDGTHVGQFTVDSKGRLTFAANVTITGASPTGAAGGDLSGTYPNPTVQSLNGATTIQIGNTASTTNTVQFASGVSTPTIDQAANTSASGVGQQFTLQAQSATGTHSTGGNLILASGNGTDTDGYVAIETGMVERLVVNASGVVQINNLSTGVVHADSSGNLTSSLIVNADVSATAAIAYSKLNLTNSIVNADINSAAAIVVSKLASGTADQLLDTNHAGTTTEWFTAGGDVTFASHNFTVVAISGASPIPITPAVLQWTAGTSSPTINQAAPTATNTPAAGQTLLINSQAGTAAVSGNNNGGAGGIAELLGGTGGTPTGTATGGAGGVSEVVGGTGGLASSTSGSTGGAGGQAELLGGTGGAGNGTGTTGGTGGAITIDAGAGGAAGGGTAGGNGSISIGTTNATSISVSRSGQTTTVNGALTVTQATTLNNSLTQSGGAVSLTGNAASSFTTTSSTLSLDAATALNLGTSTATSVAIGRSGITTTVTGGLSQATGALNLTANAASQITTSSGLLTITAAAASTWSTSAGALTLTSAAAATWSTSAGVLSLSGNTGVSLQTNTTPIAKIDSNKFYTIKGYSQNVTIKTHADNQYTVLATDNIIAADVSGGVLTVNLPTSPAVGDTYAVKDYKGAATTSNITVDSGSGNQIDAARTFLIDVNYGSITVVCVATSPNQWMVM